MIVQRRSPLITTSPFKLIAIKVIESECPSRVRHHFPFLISHTFIRTRKNGNIASDFIPNPNYKSKLSDAQQ